ncbi:MAG TPA: hypothetical protein VEA81_14945 [Burkholderiaceae bacterium]|nr:hypothetical protein [Burkholderiaceae bacterium]
MSDPRNPNAQAGTSATADDVLQDPTLSRQVLDLVRGWVRRSGEASAAQTEAAIDRGSFESFPASDPVASAVATAERGPMVRTIDCTMTTDSLVFRICRGDDTASAGPPPAYVLDGEVPDGGRLSIRVWVDDAAPEATVPESLVPPAEHASLRPQQTERRSGDERRAQPRTMPAGFDRRLAQRRAASSGNGVPL